MARKTSRKSTEAEDEDLPTGGEEGEDSQEEQPRTALKATRKGKSQRGKFPVRKLPPKQKFEGGTLLGTVYHQGKGYGPGDEEAFSKAKVNKEFMQVLANKGIIDGFDTEAAPAKDEDEE